MTFCRATGIAVSWLQAGMQPTLITPHRAHQTIQSNFIISSLCLLAQSTSSQLALSDHLGVDASRLCHVANEWGATPRKTRAMKPAFISS
jgi:hypothetical protein